MQSYDNCDEQDLASNRYHQLCNWPAIKIFDIAVCIILTGSVVNNIGYPGNPISIFYELSEIRI